jgi:membrane-bound serine protease (ClpP class)
LLVSIAPVNVSPAMLRFITCWVWLLIIAAVGSPLAAQNAAPAPTIGPKKTVVVIPVRTQIDDPTLYVLRRGLKEAIEDKVDVVILDMKTPGGSAGVALEMMEALVKFPGTTITFVNDEAISAGAFIATATEEIWFAPRSVIGAAAAVTATGEDIPETMRLKFNSFLRAKVRAFSEGRGYRGQVISAMIDKDYELKIDDKIIKKPGELLSLTADEAFAKYGDPAQPLLAAGLAKNLDELLTTKFGAGNYSVRQLQVTWSEKLAQYLSGISPVLLGLGMLALFIEFKTPGFGVFGIVGIVLLGIVFISSYVAGLSGHEPVLFFVLGLLLVVAEILFFPGVVLPALAGLVLMLGSLVWALADLWPNEPLSVSSDAFVRPLISVASGLAGAVVLGFLLARFLPRGWFWDRLVLQAAVAGSAQRAGSADLAVGPSVSSNLVGRTGVAATALFPTGQIEIDGKRYEARVALGTLPQGSKVVVVRAGEFDLLVEPAAS